MRTTVRRSSRWWWADRCGSAGSASVEFALLTTAVAAATLAVTVGLEAVAGGSFGELMDRLSQTMSLYP